MQVSEIITELGDHGFANTINSTRQLWFINDTIWDICSREKWPFLEKTATLSFNGSTGTPTNWPADFKAVEAIVDTGTGQVLQAERVEFLDKRNANNLNLHGDPVWYYLRGSGGTSASDPDAGTGAPTVATFWPIPGVTSSLQMRYIAQHPYVAANAVETAIWIPPQHHRVIVLGALWKCFDLEDDPEMAMRYQQLFETRIESMKRDIFLRQYDRPDRIYVLGDDDYALDYF
jgi:hypothetical protein